MYPMIFLAISYASCAVMFFALAAYVAKVRPHPSGRALAIACTMTALWASAWAWRMFEGNDAPSVQPFGPVESIVETARPAAWLLALLLLLHPATGTVRLPHLWRGGLAILMASAAALVALDLVIANRSIHLGAVWHTASTVGHVALAMVGLVLVENLLRNSGRDQFWALKFLCIGLGCLFVYDFFLFADAFLSGIYNYSLIEARGGVALATALLIAMSAKRTPMSLAEVSISRRLAFFTATMVGSGLYLVVLTGAGFYIRAFDGDWGPLGQIALSVAALILLASAVTSGRFRARAKVFAGKHLFAHKYDYREEWLRFIRTIGQNDGTSNLGKRVTQAIGQIVESPGGALWLWSDSNQCFSTIATWNLGAVLPDEPAGGGLARFLSRTLWVIDLGEQVSHPERYPGLDRPAWLAGVISPWLIVPLVHGEHLYGFVLLQESRAPQQLNWEDYDLLKTVGRQGATYLAEQQTTQLLADAREMERFSKRSAFAVHDIKNVVGQLSLAISSAGRHGHDPDFQSDVIATIRDSVESMNRLLTQLDGEPKPAGAGGVIDLVPVVRRLATVHAEGTPQLNFNCAVPDLRIKGDEARIGSIIHHLVQNAVEAAGERGRVDIRLREAQGNAVIEVDDNGPGMSVEFIRERLFRPFDSTKPSGYGLGAYQCRELAREMGGQLTARSVPRQGTTMRLTFPIADRSIDHMQQMLAAS